MSERTCVNCRFWNRDTEGYSVAHCHRNAPAAVLFRDEKMATSLVLLLWWYMSEQADTETADKQLKDFGLSVEGEVTAEDTYWPRTQRDDWCGQWERRA